MLDKELDDLVALSVKTLGEDVVKATLRDMVNAERGGRELTIIANEGVHHLPANLMRGEVYYLSQGSLDFSSRASIYREFEECLGKLAAKLRGKNWDSVYLVPFGPTVLSALAKLLVYRVTGLETVDVMHTGGGNYVDVDMDLRALVLSHS